MKFYELNSGEIFIDGVPTTELTTTIEDPIAKLMVLTEDFDINDETDLEDDIGTYPKVSGRVDTTTAPEFEAVMDECIVNLKELILDCKEMEYISSAGLRMPQKSTYFYPKLLSGIVINPLS